MTDQTRSGLREEASSEEPQVPQARVESELITFSDAPTEPEPKRPKRLWIATAILGAGVVAAGVTLGPTTWRIIAQKDATIAMPNAIGALTRDDSVQAKETANDLVTALQAGIELDHTAGAIYTDPAGADKSVMLFGGTTLLLSPEKELDTVLKLMDDAGDGVKGLSKVDPGPLAGIMKCGATGTETSPMAVCGWADHGSIALALFPGRTPADAEQLMRQLRAAVQTR